MAVETDVQHINASFERLLALIPKHVLSDQGAVNTGKVSASVKGSENTTPAEAVPSSRAGQSIEDLRAKMRDRIESLRAQHTNPNRNEVAGLPVVEQSSPGKEQLIGERRKQLAAEAEDKARLAKERKNRKKRTISPLPTRSTSPQKMESHESDQFDNRRIDAKSTAEVDVEANPSSSTPSERDGDITFSKFDFNVAQRSAVDTLPCKKGKSSSKNPEVALSRLQDRKSFLEHLTPQSRERAEEKDKWEGAVKRAEGGKVFDNEAKLNKMIKTKEKSKHKSKKAWAERKAEIEAKQASRQKTRTENLAARKQNKKEGKSAKKKGKSRPGFEGSNRLKKSKGSSSSKPGMLNKAGTKRKRS